MLSQPAYRVFISSTATDLKQLRDRILDTILKAGHIPLNMVLWPSSPFPTLRVIREDIKNCDIFVSIVGARYGSLIDDPEINGRKISYTEFEFEYALELKRPTLAFLLDDVKFDQQRKQLEPADPELRFYEQLCEFRRKLQKTPAGQPRNINYFNDEVTLVSSFIQSLHSLTHSSAFQSPGLSPTVKDMGSRLAIEPPAAC